MALALTAIGLLLLLVQGTLPAGHLRQFLLFNILWIIPGALWSLWLTGPILERLLGGAGLALYTPLLLALIASYVPGPLPSWALTLVAFAGLAIPLLIRITVPLTAPANSEIPKWTGAAIVGFCAIIALTVLLRLVNIEYKEFQGDEVVAMVRAAQTILGDELGLLRHQKGPAEILVPLVSWGLGGSINELWARLPFTWAGILVVLAVAAVGARASDRASGLLAALLFAMGGFAIAFARIVQYQSFVMFWSLLALLFSYRYRRHGTAADLILCATFLAAGLLAHYDAILFVPAVAWNVLSYWRRQPRHWTVHALAAIVSGGIPLALFYVPYLANPTFGGTGSYLINERLGGFLFTWSGPDVWRMATFYNSTYYVLLLAALAVAGALAGANRRNFHAVLLFTLGPLLFYVLIVADPRTHIYTFFPGLALVAGAGASALWRRLQSRRVRWTGAALFAAAVAICLWYVVLIFVDVTPERQRTWTENRPRFFPITWDEPPIHGLFGFPHQAGWRRAPEVVVELPYASNEESDVTNWYMAQAARTHCPDYQTLLIASDAQDAVPYDAGRAAELSPQATITVNGRSTLRIFDDQPGKADVTLEATGHDLWRTPRQLVPEQYGGEIAVGTVLDDRIKLLGYSLDKRVARPGETLNLVLYWQALQPMDRNYQVLVHLYDGTMWGQDDGAPDCAMQPTAGWEPGDIIRDAHQIVISPDAPAADIPLFVGFYDLLTGVRMTTEDTGEDTIRLGDIDVRHP